MIEVAQRWSEEYPSPSVSVEVTGGGSGVGIAALISGTVDIANASREMKESEIEQAKNKTGKDPKRLIVGYDALAIYVHKDNPLEEISLDQLKHIYEDGGDITKWSQLGVQVPGCGDDNIVLLGRQNNSGTYEYFREHILGKNGKFRLNVSKASGSKDLVTRVGSLPCAIGYSGMGYKTDAVKFLKVKVGDAPAVLPSVDTVHDESYAVSRPLFVYTLGDPEGEIKTYLEWVRSDDGQKILEDIGYVPLSPAERTKPAPAAPAEKPADKEAE
jgi:phosphate transport system substrate-binding protein